MLMMMFTLFGPISISASSSHIPYPTIKDIERHYKLPKGLLDAVIKVESNGVANAVNHNDGTIAQKKAGIKVKSYGLMQIQLATARHMGFRGTVQELRKTHINVGYGAKYLRFLLNRHKQDVAWSLTCFNGGENSFSCKERIYGRYAGKILNAWNRK